MPNFQHRASALLNFCNILNITLQKPRCYTLALLLFAGVLLPHDAVAQDIHWTRTLNPLTEAIAFNPLSHGLVIYAAAKDSEGIYKSYDGGYHWHHLYGGANPLEAGSSANIGQIFVLPSDTSVLLVASTNVRTGLYRSTDGGYNWKQTLPNVSSDGQTIYSFLDKLNQGHDTIYFGESATGHIWRSLDKGVTWDSLPSAINQPGLCTLVADPVAHTVLLAGSAGGVITRSTDGGSSWDTTHFSEPTGLADVPRLVFDPKNHLRAWATVYYYPNEWLLRSDDGGKTWQKRPSPPNEWAFDIDPANPKRMWMGRFSGLDSLFGGTDTLRDHFDQSTDGGETWTKAGLDTVVDIWVIKYDSSSGRLAVASGSGVYIAEVGTRSVARGVPVTQGIYPNPANSSIKVKSTAKELEIIDLLGRTMWRSSAREPSAISVAGWPNGMYSLVERDRNMLRTSRFVVSH